MSRLPQISAEELSSIHYNEPCCSEEVTIFTKVKVAFCRVVLRNKCRFRQIDRKTRITMGGGGGLEDIAEVTGLGGESIREQQRL